MSPQVVACSFVYGSAKARNKAESDAAEDKYLLEHSTQKLLAPLSTAPSQNLTPNSGSSIWPPGPRADIRNSQPGIDLMRG